MRIDKPHHQEPGKYVPQAFVEHLRAEIPRFANEKLKHQLALAHLLWVADEKRRRHHFYDDYCSFWHQELDLSFGKGNFSTINHRLGLFDVKPWLYRQGGTRGYRMRHAVVEVRQRYLWRRPTGPIELLLPCGKTMRRAPKSINSKDMRGNRYVPWKATESLRLVPVDQRALLQLQTRLLTRSTASVHAPCASAAPSFQYEAEFISKLLHLSNTRVGGEGKLMHRYTQAQSGRIYARDVNLQNAPRAVRRAALRGCYDYDVSNCHYTLLVQILRRLKIRHPALDDYVEHKSEVRSSIASSTGLDIADVKLALIAVIYGARISADSGAIVDEIGAEGASRLLESRPFKSIADAVKDARKDVLEFWPISGNGSLTNDFGKAIARNAPPSKQLAHLLQGAEAKAMLCAHTLSAEHIVLLQHDGFTSTSRLDVGRIEAEILKETGYSLRLEEEPLEPEAPSVLLPEQLDTLERPNHLELPKDLGYSSGGGFRNFPPASNDVLLELA